MEWNFRLICIAWLSLQFLPFLHAQAQDSLKQPTPAEQAKEALKAIRTKLPIHKPTKDILDSLSALQQINEAMRSLHTELTMLMIHPDPAVRREAFRTMAAISRASDHASAAATHLTKGINDPAPDVSVACLDGLARLGPAGMAGLPNAIEAFKSKDPRIRRAAIGMIGAFAPEDKRLIPILISALDDPDTGIWEKEPGTNSVSMLAMMRLELCKLAAKDATPKLVQFVEEKKWTEFYHGIAIRTLIAIDPDHPLPLNIARGCLKRKEIHEQVLKGAILVTFLGAHGKAAMPDLIAVLKMAPLPDPEKERSLKATVLAAVQAIGPAGKEALTFLRAMPELRNPNMRLYVENAIKSLEREK